LSWRPRGPYASLDDARHRRVPAAPVAAEPVLSVQLLEGMSALRQVRILQCTVSTSTPGLGVNLAASIAVQTQAPPQRSNGRPEGGHMSEIKDLQDAARGVKASQRSVITAPPLRAAGSSLAELEYAFGAHHYQPLPVVLVRGEGVYLWDE